MGQNYKETLNLPKTDFPMKANLATREPEMLKKWQEAGLYEQIQAARADAELFVLHDGPPFANGDVHMGTALNKILKDLRLGRGHGQGSAGVTREAGGSPRDPGIHLVLESARRRRARHGSPVRPDRA